MKKLLTLILSALLLVASVFSLVGCGNNQKVKLIEVDLSSEEYAFAVKKTDTVLLASINQFFKDKKTEVDAIFDKYTADGVDLSTFGTNEIATTPTGSDNELVVATNLDFAPFEYTNGSKIAGIDMEIAQLLATYLNKTLVVVHMDFEAVVNSIETLDTYDVGIAGLTISDERKEQVAFSDPYFGATQAIIVKEDDTTFDGLTTAEQVEEKLASLTGDAAKCGGQKATTSQFYINGNESFEFDGFDNLTFSPYSGASVAVQDMLNGNISFVVVDKTTAQALVSTYNK